jgi:hypothetical protein
MSNWEQSIGVWLAIATGVVTGLGTMFAIWREWQQFRQNQVARLNSAAIVAVRRTEAAVVRPLLTLRMMDAVNRFVQEHPQTEQNRFRFLLFCEWYSLLRLSEEKRGWLKKPPLATLYIFFAQCNAHPYS